MKKTLLSLAFALALFHSPVALATSFTFQDGFQEFQGSVTEESVSVDPTGEGVTLPSFDTEATEGAGVIVYTIKRFLDFFKLVVSPMAVLFAIVMGFRMVTAGRENEEVAGHAKNYIRYAVEGLIVIFVADSLVNVIFGAQGEVFRGGEAGAQDFAQKANNLMTGLYGLVETLIGAIAVSMLVSAGLRYVGGSYDDDQIAKAKKQIQWSLVGLFVIGLGEFVIKDILFPNQGTDLGVDKAKLLLVNLTNFMTGFMGTISFVSLLYAGFLYVTGVQNEDNVAKAKKIIMWSLGGIVIALSAYAITNTVVTLDSSR